MGRRYNALKIFPCSFCLFKEIKSILSNISSAEHHLQQVLSQLHPPPPPPPPPPLATSTPSKQCVVCVCDDGVLCVDCAEIEDGEEDNEVVPTPEAADDDEEMVGNTD